MSASLAEISASYWSSSCWLALIWDSVSTTCPWISSICSLALDRSSRIAARRASASFFCSLMSVSSSLMFWMSPWVTAALPSRLSAGTSTVSSRAAASTMTMIRCVFLFISRLLCRISTSILPRLQREECYFTLAGTCGWRSRSPPRRWRPPPPGTRTAPSSRSP